MTQDDQNLLIGYLIELRSELQENTLAVKALKEKFTEHQKESDEDKLRITTLEKNWEEVQDSLKDSKEDRENYNKSIEKRFDSQDETMKTLQEDVKAIRKVADNNAEIFGGEEEFAEVLKSLSRKKKLRAWFKIHSKKIWITIVGVVTVLYFTSQVFDFHIHLEKFFK